MNLPFGDLSGAEARRKAAADALALKKSREAAAAAMKKEQLDAQIEAMLVAHLKEIKRQIPTSALVPNVGQERALRHLKKTPFPKDIVMMGGNGGGKSVNFVKIFTGCIWGPRVMVEPGFDPLYPEGDQHYEAWTIFREIAKERGEPIYAFIVAAADSLKEGALSQRIKRYFPRDCWLGKKQGKQYMAIIYCWDTPELKAEGDTSKCVAIIDIKTPDQPDNQIPGPDYDFGGFDEPPEPGIYKEMIGRCRASEHSFRFYSMTPLDTAGWFIDSVVQHADNPKARVVVDYVSLWDNCGNWHPDASMWSGGEVGSGELLNRGTKGVTKSNIDSMIDSWNRIDPISVQARVWGKATHLSGSIYKLFSPAIHVQNDLRPPAGWEEWPVWNIIDPHHARPPAVGWFLQGPDVNGKRRAWGIGEYPFEQYDKIQAKGATIQDYAEIILEMEQKAGIEGQVIYRYGDPNSLMTPYASRTEGSTEALSIRDIYANSGLFYELANDSMRTGHEAVNELIYYDPEKPLDGENEPGLIWIGNIFNEWQPQVNFPIGMSRYGFKKKSLDDNASPKSLSSIVQQEYKDFPDLVRYFGVTVRDFPFQKLTEQKGMMEMIEMQRRNPKAAAAVRRLARPGKVV